MSTTHSSAWIAIVPARAGSVGIPGKNRRAVEGVTLAERAMDRALLITGDQRSVIVSTDDPIVEMLARFRGHTIHHRPSTLTGPDVTIAQVVNDVIRSLERDDSPSVAICQPTSPNLRLDAVIAALDAFNEHKEWSSLATVVEESHLLWWEQSDATLRPVYHERVNRQYRRDHVWRETGGLMLVRRWDDEGSLISDAHHLFEIPEDESTDVDTPYDLVLAHARAATRTIEWRIIAGQQVGYGHLYRCLALADELPHHRHRFVVDGPEEALTLVRARHSAVNYGEYYAHAADVVVFDCLNVQPDDYQRARDENALVIGIELESMPASAWMDLYINELASEDPLTKRASVSRIGPDYASLRDEFQIARRAVEERWSDDLCVPNRVLISFGGEDPEHMTEQCLEVLVGRYDVCAVIGPGFAPDYAARLRRNYRDVLLEAHQAQMAQEMLKAHVVITSAGRTAWEASALGAVIVTIPVNEREREHAWPTLARRVPRHNLDDGTLRFLVDASLMDKSDGDARRERALASRADGRGAQRFAWLMDGLIRGVL